MPIRCAWPMNPGATPWPAIARSRWQARMRWPGPDAPLIERRPNGRAPEFVVFLRGGGSMAGRVADS